MVMSLLFNAMECNGGDEMEERRSIRDSGKALKKYGSMAKHVARNENLVKHLVSKTDTLQGIALKYGVTTEQIRRVNRLWASDSLFLREHLLIPVPADNTLSFAVDESPSTSETAGDRASASSPSSLTSSIDEDSSINDFLAKMDSSIATVKKDVRRAQGNSEFCSEDEESFVQRRRAIGRFRNSQTLSSNSHLSSSSSESLRPSSTGDVHSLPSAVVMTQGKRIKTSLQRLQQQQDEMFQL